MQQWLHLYCFACSFGLSAVRQSSNIFFTNGIYDPFIACGPTVNISSTIIAAVYGECTCLKPNLASCMPQGVPHLPVKEEDDHHMLLVPVSLQADVLACQLHYPAAQLLVYVVCTPYPANR